MQLEGEQQQLIGEGEAGQRDGTFGQAEPKFIFSIELCFERR